MAILTAGALIFAQHLMGQANEWTQNMMDQWSRNCFGNTFGAVNVAKVVGAALVIVDVLLAGLWLACLRRRGTWSCLPGDVGAAASVSPRICAA
jgi:hypothetical protein